MKTKHMLMAILALTTALSACKKENDEIDTDYPTIDVTGTAFPQQCTILKRGEKFVFKAKLSDNIEIGSVSVDIHHNFDHHSHSTEVNECGLAALKQPVNPLLLIKTLAIPTGQKFFETAEEITVPVDVDPGDYHFLIRLTDKTGWQTIKGLSIKIN